MKILKLILEGYEGVTDGMRLPRLEIDFSICTKKFILVLGANGKGKSTILSALHPFAETFNDKDPIANKGEGYKEIIYQDGKDIFIIKHFYGASMSSYISKNKVELNPNGKVKSFEQLVKDELSVTKEFFKLLSLGSESQNFISMNSTTRKNFIGKFMPSIDEYLSAYTVVNKKVNEQVKQIKSINEDISLLGDKVALSQKLETTKDLLETLKATHFKTQKEISGIEAQIDISKNNLLQFEGIISEWDSLKDSKEINADEIISFVAKYPSTLTGKTKADIKLMIKETTFSLNESIASEDKLREVINTLTLDINQYTMIIANAEKTIKNLNLATLADINKISNNLQEAYNKKNQFEISLKAVSKKIKLKEINEAFSETALIEFSYQLTYLTQNILAFNDDQFESLKTEFKITSLSTDSLDALFESVNKKYTATERELDKLNDTFDTENHQLIKDSATQEIILMCKDKSCAVYAKNVKFSNLQKTVADLQKKINIKNASLKTLSSNIDLLVKYIDFNVSMGHLIAYVEKHKSLFTLSGNLELYNAFSNKDKLYDLFTTVGKDDILNKFNIFKQLNEFVFTYKRLLQIDETITLFTDRIQTYNNAIELSEKERATIFDNKSELEKSTLLVNVYKAERADLQEKIKRFKNKSTALETFNTLLINRDSLAKEFNTIDKEYKKCEADRKYLDDSIESLENTATELKDLDNNIETLDNEIISLKLKILKYTDLEDKLKLITENRKHYLIIKDALDIKTGIPLVLLGKYMEDIKVNTNKLLKMAFNHPFSIDFKLTDTEFKVPVLKNGKTKDDVSLCSSGQVSLIKIALSLGIIIQAIQNLPKKYNIPVLDELDGQLDPRNRTAFINILHAQIKLLNAEQCFIISHNDNFADAELGLILLEDALVDCTDPLFMSNKEIVFDIDNFK